MPDVSQPYWFLGVTVVVFAVVLGRYFVIAGLFYGVFHLWFPARWQKRRVVGSAYKPNQFKKEVFWSTITALIFAVSGAGTLLLWQKGYTKLYLNVHEYPAWWLPVSLLLSMVLHETYYYWLHRWMHRPAIFKLVHKVHHNSHITSPWTAFSFHPIEGVFQAIYLPILLMVLPMHLSVLIVQLTIMTFSSVINHLNIEVYPKNFHKHFLGRWLIGATHHSLHHRQFKYNYGLYFTFWDKWKHTESPMYEDLFDEKTISSSIMQGEGVKAAT
ncbi:MAG: sterol desaturase family protein [Flavisolibacter sp.]